MSFHDEHALLQQLSWVQRLAHRICADAALAEDVSQESMLAAFRSSLPHREEGPGLRRWLGGIVRNQARMARRTVRRREAREAGLEVGGVEPSALEIVERASTQRTVVDAVLALEEPYRTTLLRRYFDDLGPVEIARHDGVPVATVKTRLRRALEQLRARLREELGEGDDGRAYLAALVPLATMDVRRGGAAAAPTRGVGEGALRWGALSPLPASMGLVVVVAVGTALVWLSVVDRSRAVAVDGPASPDPVSVSSRDLAASEPRRAVVEMGGVAEGTSSAGQGPVANAEGDGPVEVTVRAFDVWGKPVRGLPIAIVSAREEGAAGAFADGAARAVGVTDDRGRLVYRQGRKVHQVGAEPERARGEWITVLAGTAFPQGDAVEVGLVVARPRRVQGVVVGADGQPVAGARVVHRSRFDLRARFDVPLDQVSAVERSCATDAMGAFAFDAVPELPGATLEVDAWGCEPRAFAVAPRGPVVTTCALDALDDARSWLRGAVRDDAGRALAGAVVSIGSVASRTDGRGRFCIEAVDGECLWAVVEGLRAARIERPVEGWPRQLEIVLRGEPLEIEGRVVDAEGRPMAGMVVALADPTRLGVLARGALRTYSMPTVEGLAVGGAASVRSRADGSFCISGLAARDYGLVVYDPVSLEGLEVASCAAGRRDLVVALGAGGARANVAGCVVGPDGAPVVGATVSLHRRFGGFDAVGPRVVADERGCFAFASSVAADGEVRVFAGGAFGTLAAPLVGFADPTSIRLELARTGAFFVRLQRPGRADRLTVERLDGTPVALTQIDAETVFSMGAGDFDGGRSPVYRVPCGEHVLVLYRDGDEVARLPLHVGAGPPAVLDY